MSDGETFERLIFFGVTLLGRPEAEVWEMRIGHLLDQITAYKQFYGIENPIVEHYIDEIIPGGL